MRTNNHKNQLRWVILLLTVVVVLPTVCSLWFMTLAVKNNRLAVRQTLLDFYTAKAREFFVDAVNSNSLEIDSEILNIRTGAVKSAAGTMYQGVLVYNDDGGLEYPVIEPEFELSGKQFDNAFHAELTGNIDNAMELYQGIAEGANPEAVRHKAALGQVRCLSKLDRYSEAVELAYDLSFPANTRAFEPQLADVILHCRVFLAELCSNVNDAKLQEYMREILDDSNYLSSAPVETTIWQLYKLIGFAQDNNLGEKLTSEIEAAKNRIKALENTLQAASVYPNNQKLTDWPDMIVRRLSAESDLYGLKFTVGNKVVLGYGVYDKILKVLHDGIENIQDNIVDIQVYDNFGQIIAGNNNINAEPFLALTPGEFFPDFEVTLSLKNNSVFEDAADKQAAIYIWTGVLVAILILSSGGIAAQVIGQQIKLNRLKNNFIATVTHELKTPLASMRILVDTLLDGNVNDQEQAREYLQLISKENLRLSRLIDNFLTFSRMERNKQAFGFSKTNPADIVEAAADAVQTKFNCGKCEFTVNVDDVHSVMADKDAMITVLTNLLDNAYKYSRDDKQIELNIFNNEDRVCFSVKDNGIGMTRRQISKIFDRFYQADSSLARRSEGTGLGLSIVKFIVDAHKGSIEVESKPGNGSEITVCIPAFEC